MLSSQADAGIVSGYREGLRLYRDVSDTAKFVRDVSDIVVHREEVAAAANEAVNAFVYDMKYTVASASYAFKSLFGTSEPTIGEQLSISLGWREPTKKNAVDEFHEWVMHSLFSN